MTSLPWSSATDLLPRDFLDLPCIRPIPRTSRADYTRTTHSEGFIWTRSWYLFSLTHPRTTPGRASSRHELRHDYTLYDHDFYTIDLEYIARDGNEWYQDLP
jgi:hypothetical protein